MRNRPLTLIVLIALNAAVLLSCFSDDPDPTGIIPGVDCSTTTPPANTAIVRIRNFAFEPATITVARGTNVVWINCESDGSAARAHTTTSSTGVWGSPLLFGQGAGQFARVFASAGSFGYFCTPHPSMVGTVIVQ